MTNSLCVTLHIVKGSLNTSFPLTIRKWVTLHMLWKAVSSHLFTGSGWHCIFWERQSHYIFQMANSLWVTLHILCKAVLSPMTNSKWVILHILWKAISSHLFLWPTACEWHSIAHFVNSTFITSLLMTNSLWVTLQCAHYLSCILTMPQFMNVLCIITTYVLIRKWVSCHIFSISSFHGIIIDCEISPTPTSYDYSPYFHFLDSQVSNVGSWGIDFHFSLCAGSV